MEKSPESEIYELKYGRTRRHRLMLLLLLAAATLVLLCGLVNVSFFAAGIALGQVWPFSPPGRTAVPHMIASYRVNQVVEPPVIQDAFLYRQSFDGRALPDWHTFSDGWDVQNGVYYGTNTRADVYSAAVYGRGYQWADYTLEADVTATGTVAPSSAGLLFRYQENGYGGQCRLGTRASGQRQLELVTPEGQLLAASFHFVTREAYRLRVTAIGTAVTCEIVGYPDAYLSATTTMPRGTVGLQNQGITGAFDNVMVEARP
jgi:hypothetical protein